MDRRRFLQSLLLVPILKPKLNLPEHSAAEDIPEDYFTELVPAIEQITPQHSSFDWMSTAHHGSVSSSAHPGWIVSVPDNVFKENDIVSIHGRGGTVAVRYGDIDAP